MSCEKVTVLARIEDTPCPKCGNSILCYVTTFNQTGKNPVGQYSRRIYCDCGYHKTVVGDGVPLELSQLTKA